MIKGSLKILRRLLNSSKGSNGSSKDEKDNYRPYDVPKGLKRIN